MTARARDSSDTWVGLGEASALLGITPATLRRWADDGRVQVFTTPGGHRRFSRTTITAMLPASRTHRPPLARLGASPERIARAYQGRHRPMAQAPWLTDERREVFRDRGRELIALLLAHLDAPDADARDERLREAKQLTGDYGREVAALGMSLADAVELFLRFRQPFTTSLASLARRRGLDTREATDLLAQAESATDALLVALMTGHSLGAGERVVTGRRPRTAGG